MNIMAANINFTSHNTTKALYLPASSTLQWYSKLRTIHPTDTNIVSATGNFSNYIESCRLGKLETIVEGHFRE